MPLRNNRGLSKPFPMIRVSARMPPVDGRKLSVSTGALFIASVRWTVPDGQTSGEIAPEA
jgi:hypothetical protein